MSGKVHRPQAQDGSALGPAGDSRPRLTVPADPLGHSAAAPGPVRRRGPGCTPYTWASFSSPEKWGNSHCCLCCLAGVQAPSTYLAQAPSGGQPSQVPPQPTWEAPCRAPLFPSVLAALPCWVRQPVQRRGGGPQGLPSEPVVFNSGVGAELRGSETALDQAVWSESLGAFCWLCASVSPPVSWSLSGPAF